MKLFNKIRFLHPGGTKTGTRGHHFGTALLIMVLTLLVALPGSQQTAATELPPQEAAAKAKELQLAGTQLQLKGNLEEAVLKYKESISYKPNPGLERLVATLEEMIVKREEAAAAGASPVAEVKEFTQHTKKQIAKEVLSPSEDNVIESGALTLYVPSGAVSEELEIVISKYDAPAPDDSPYYTVTDEYEITGPDGEHVLFDKPVYFGLDMADEEEALRSSYQIFDEYMGVWVQAETLYNRGDGKLYLVTDHFSGFRKFASVMYKGAKRMTGEAADSAKKKIEYIYQVGKDTKELTVELAEEAYVMAKDATVEEFVGVTDADEKFIIYYRAYDAVNDSNIPDTARQMTAAFVTAYDEYKELFGKSNVPSTKRKIGVFDLVSDPKGFIDSVTSDKAVLVPHPINVYLDPRYNKAGAKASIVTGNITMPSDYHGDSLASTCAHELFHAVQHKQLAFEQVIYMGDGGPKALIGNLIDNRYTGGDKEVYRLFSNNKWFLEATAEYAARFIGTSVGVGAPIHKSIEANRAYYAFNGTHEYGISSFLDYIITARHTDEGSSKEGLKELRKEGFKELWYAVTENYTVITDVNSSLDSYVYRKLKTSVQMLYEEFWKDVFTRSFMPDAVFIAGGLKDGRNLSETAKTTSRMEIKKNGVGIFRYNLTPSSVFNDGPALTRSFWLEASPGSLTGEVYRLPSLDMDDRVSVEPPFEGAVNVNDGVIKDVLVPYSAGDSFALIAVFKNTPAADANTQVTLSSTSVHWDNQENIEEKVGNATLSSSDKLKFTPVLPKQRAGDPPFNAVVTLNNSEDYRTEIDKVENGKPFEVGSPMKELPPDKVSANIKIYRDGELVHEYQSGELVADAMVYITGPATLVVELTKEELPYKHQFTATAWPEGEYRFSWIFNNGVVQDTTGKNESSVSAEYSEFKLYKPSVTLYDMRGNKLASTEVHLTLKEKEAPAEPTPEEKPVSTDPVELDPDSDTVPVASSGSFVCRTWINTSMDSFTVGGGTLTGADWGYSRGYRSYNLIGTSKTGETVSLNISATMGKMGYQMEHKGNNLIMHLKVYDTSGKEITESTQKIEILKSGAKSLSDAVSIAVPANASRVEMSGSFSCNWVTPYAAASETVAVMVKLKVAK